MRYDNSVVVHNILYQFLSLDDLVALSVRTKIDAATVATAFATNATSAELVWHRRG